jgi:hypothetical protein
MSLERSPTKNEKEPSEEVKVSRCRKPLQIRITATDEGGAVPVSNNTLPT